MADPITVYKVVREDRRGCLRSAVLRGTAALHYRDLKGRIRVVKSSLAFGSANDARIFLEDFEMVSLQLWKAEAATSYPESLVAPIAVRHHRPGDRRRLVDHIRAGNLTSMRAAPRGTVFCTNLRLVERVA